MATTCCLAHDPSPTRIATPTWAARLTDLWSEAVQGWRDRARVHAELRALDGLDDRTLHDIGLAERRMGSGLPGAWRVLRGPWRDPRDVL